MKVSTILRYNPRHSDGEGLDPYLEQAQETQDTSGRTESTGEIDSQLSSPSVVFFLGGLWR